MTTKFSQCIISYALTIHTYEFAKTKKSPKDMVVVLELMGKSLALALAFGRHEKQYWHSRHFQGDPAL